MRILEIEAPTATWFLVCLFTAIVYWMANNTVITMICPKHLKYKWRELNWWKYNVSTFIFSIIASTAGIYSVLTGPEDMFHTVAHRGTPLCGYILAISLGYFIAEVLYVYEDRRLTEWVFVHHLIIRYKKTLNKVAQFRIMCIQIMRQKERK
ncbi:uncharacterized protein LOC124455067 isoform X3 [Xenia sp. Carnegie-2017]|uniref:uncharacterized protein LOC124455067 isoform X2 n=1 Tax=Xenia sp. Carnegie-2017 TaxID=2897299 RepID=UPI001F041EDB|nr:uncharacterized protein LOC124455067 isoform X2 [Xenia sp. Carnegie-2017]XP_046861779.1 uncharacterized protein LOC124455067 isoform X3 [Xenia sp. Carnegie-2017]